MYKHDRKQFMYKHELEGFMSNINFRSIISKEEWGKFKEEKIDKAEYDKDIDIEFVIKGLDYGEDGMTLGNNGSSLTFDPFEGADVEIFANVSMVKENGTEKRKGYRCIPPDSYEECKKWIGKQIFIITDELVEIPRHSVVTQAKLYKKGYNEAYKARLEEKQRADKIKNYFDTLNEKADKLHTPWIVKCKNDRNEDKYRVAFEFMGGEVKVYCKNKMSAIIVTNYLFELDANRLFQGKLDFPECRYTNIEKKLDTSLEEYAKMKGMISLDPIYGLVKDRINYVIRVEKLDHLLSKDLKDFLKIEVSKMNGEILDNKLADLAAMNSK